MQMPRSLTRHGFFVAGTDTGVGKTFAAVAIIRSLVRANFAVAGMKPVAAGAALRATGFRNDDALALAGAANVKAPYTSVNPYCFKEPVSPHIAADAEGITIDVGTILQEFDNLKAQADCVVVEGAGGWLVPIGNGLTMADVAVALALPVVMVVGLRLGCLNHAALTARAITSSGLRLDHWIANEIDPAFARREENIATLVGVLGEPLAILPHVRDKKPPELAPEAGTRLAETL
jgi:dethiobiotin synthetase